tara:strand:+ start:2090 stop:2362 length:273 start_codon:yes stop_codon:yes gene_type:complete
MKKKPCGCKKGKQGKKCDCPSHEVKPRWKRNPSFDKAPVTLHSGKPSSPRSTESRGMSTALGLMNSGPQRNIPAGKPGSHLGWAPAGPGL